VGTGWVRGGRVYEGLIVTGAGTLVGKARAGCKPKVGGGSKEDAAMVTS
jgi:hypothetical protein